MLQPGDKVCGKYIIHELVGQGGMSAVYRARRISDNRELAIKDVDRRGEKDNQIFTQSLTVEGEMLRKLDNSHLPHVHDIIENENNFMLVMDFVSGESLDKVIERKGAQSVNYIYNWGMQICDVLSYLHRQNPPIIYRDMKPANVILQPDGKLMLIDFGTARTQKGDSGMRSDTTCIGTEGFAAPEQYGGLGQSDARTDIYCLGATLYSLATGHNPYEKPKGILPLKTFVPELDGSPLNDIIQKCTRTNPLDRYQTADELRMDLAVAEAGLYDAPPESKSAGWIKQKVKGVGGVTKGLSGFLQREKKPAAAEAPDPTSTRAFQPAKDRSRPWQENAGEGQLSGYPAAPGALKQPQRAIPPDGPVPIPEPPSSGNIFKILMIAACVAAVLFLAVGIILVAGGIETAGMVLLIFAFAAALLAVFGAVGYLREK